MYRKSIDELGPPKGRSPRGTDERGVITQLLLQPRHAAPGCVSRAVALTVFWCRAHTAPELNCMWPRGPVYISEQLQGGASSKHSPGKVSTRAEHTVKGKKKGAAGYYLCKED